MGRGENNVYNETMIQGGHNSTVCAFPNLKSKEITRGDVDSDANIR